MGNASHKRWIKAQKYESGWWEKLETTDYDWYRHCSEQVKRLTLPYLTISKETKILEIGSGPIGILTFLKSSHRYAIDPLEDYFSSVEENKEHRDSDVKYFSGQAEELPYENRFFDLIIIDNVLDHCENPAIVVKEMNRVIKNSGIIYVRQNVYHFWAKLVRRLLEFFMIDLGHPHTFSESQMLRFADAKDWKLRYHDKTGFFSTWLSDLLSGLKGLIKFLFIITRSTQVYIWQISRINE